MPTRQDRLKDPWIDYGYGVTLFVPQTSRVRMGANPVQETRYSAKCIYQGQGTEPRWVNLEGKLVGQDELYDLTLLNLDENYALQRLLEKALRVPTNPSGFGPTVGFETEN